MKFKKNEMYIVYLLFVYLIVFVSLIINRFSKNALDNKTVLFLLVATVCFSVLYMFFIRGLFYDTIYYDEYRIKIVTRKSVSEYNWKDIKRIERIIGGRGGTVGWKVVTNDGDEFNLLPANTKFIDFVKATLPEIEIKEQF